MSGISGIFNLDGSPVDCELLRRMTEVIRHRGPDGVGYWSEGPVGLGHQMFWATEESLYEKQPLRNESGTVCLTFDGRVDNREELQAALKSKAVHLRDATDTELVLRAYECWGEDSPQRILGDFAYVIWDGRARRLFCARDILGLKPLYYFTNGRIFLFGSELRQLFEFTELPRKPNEGMIAEHLADEVTSREETLWERILRVPPAHVLIVEPNRPLRKTRYWDIDHSKRIQGTDQEYAERFLQLFKESVRCRLRSPGGLGVELSGGLDSSSIACMSASLREEGGTAVRDLESLSLVFPGRDCDETHYIESAVRKWNLPSVAIGEEHKETGWYAAQIERYRDLSDYPNAAMCEPLFQAASQRGLRVLLNGIGGDQWFQGCSVGSSRWQVAHLPRRFRGLWRLYQRAGLAGALRHAAGRLQTACNRTVARRVQPVPWWIGPKFARKTALAERIKPATGTSAPEPGAQQLERLLNSGWTAHANEANERAKSRSSIDGRSPFFDRRIIEFSFAIPEDQRGRKESTKVVLRNAMRGLLPEMIRNRRDKAEFGHTFCQSLAVPEVKRCFDVTGLAQMGWVEPGAVRRMYKRAMVAHACGRRATDIWPLWTIFLMELWTRRFVFAD